MGDEAHFPTSVWKPHGEGHATEEAAAWLDQNSMRDSGFSEGQREAPEVIRGQPNR